MMSFFKNTKLMGAVVIVLALLVVGYYYWSGSSSSSDAVTTADATGTPASQDLLTLLGNLHSITLNPAIFSDPNFEALSDFGVTIPPESAGRGDPFAPIGSSFTTSASSTPSQ
jgi:hypothetical protein